MAGAHVATTCSAGNFDYVAHLGADVAIDYRREDVAESVKRFAPDGLDWIVDTVGQGTLLQGIDLVRRGGVVAPIGTLITNEPQPDAVRAAANGVRVVPTMSTLPVQGRQLRGLVAALSDGRMHAPALETVELAQAGEAHRRVQGGHVRGKILLRVAGEAVG
jgi:NADPH:quinone reductase-like Zn-dependent oxidoreductase